MSRWGRRPYDYVRGDVMKIGVVGSGTMGTGIGQVFAQNGHEVNQVDFDESKLSNSRKTMELSLSRLIKKNLLSEEIKTILSRVKFSTDFNNLRDADLVIEAVYERIDVKKNVLEKISEIVKESTLIGTNTSSISINTLSSIIKRPERFMGIHFFNPVPVMKLVELVTSVKTEPETVNKIRNLLMEMDKAPVVSKDFPGFISNRVLMQLIREAILVLEEGIATKEDIDKTFKLGMNHPMGPLELADFIGLDVCKDIMDVLYVEYGDPRFKPPIALRNSVSAGNLGRKSGEGFYKYGDKNDIH